MKKNNKDDFKYLAIIYGLITLFIIILYLKGYIFGSNVDWISQHYSIPEYFRTLFYQDKNLFPNFALNLGLGQNIFYFAYHGLFSPFTLLAYLFPFISMRLFIQIISILIYYLSVFLLYKWLNNKFDKNISFIGTFIFALSGPLFMHSHRHVMFVLYLPFLLNSLSSIDNYFEEKKIIKLIINVFLMIMTSYFYSVSGILVIGIYTIYKVLKKNIKINIKSFIPLFKVIGYVMLAILLSSFFLFPTFYALMAGRADSNVSIKILDLFVTKYKFNLSLYHAYSFGLTFLFLMSLINLLIKKKKENIFLGIVLLLCVLVPFISYLLNGFMYIDGKVFIPFIPLAILAICYFIEQLLAKKINLKLLIILLLPLTGYMIYSSIDYSNLFLVISNYKLNILFFDIAICFISLFLVFILNKKSIYLFLIIPLVSFLKLNLYEDYVTQNQINNFNEKETITLLSDKSNNNLYRTSISDNVLENVNRIYNINQFSSSIYSSSSNQKYVNFVRNIFQNEVINKDKTTITQTSNVLFNIYTGTKYLITKDKPLIGYYLLNEQNEIALYKNNNVLPIIYSSNKLMSLREFNSLKYPYTMDALLNYIIVDHEIENVFKSKIKPINLNYIIEKKDNIDYKIENNKLFVYAKTNASAKLQINSIKDQILIIKFTMDNVKSGYGCSTNISINGINNSLSCSDWKYFNDNYTFEYVLSSNEVIDNLDILFTKGNYEIKNIETYILDYEDILTINKNINAMIINEKTIKNNTISGTINVINKGYIKTTIPFEEKGFKVYVDNKLVKNELVDLTFLGFEIDSGKHEIKIIYNAPYFDLGKTVSIISLCVLISLLIIKKKQLSNNL